MSLNAGTRIGQYQILSAIGAGGMGEVYRARDGTLHRDVALKVLPEAFASDPDRLARFRREAQVLAALNHPNIAAIYGFEESSSVQALVLELVEGPTLADRIAEGPMPVDEALPIAREIAEALEAAHEQGITHRDLKPANIKLRPDGTVKVLDFGLAKLHDPSGPDAPNGPNVLSMSPTITSPAMMTGVGVLLGTAAYMSPEQAKGRAADKRSDIWAFGCVLYEMLTGRRAFDGEDMTDVLGAVVRLEPKWDSLGPDVPPAVRMLLQQCLVKDRRKRIADIAAGLFVLDHHVSLAATNIVTPSLPPKPLWRRAVMPAATALAASAIVGAGVWFVTRAPDPVPPAVSRLVVASSGAAALSTSFNYLVLAMTPDGSRLVYVGNRTTQLFVRALDSLEPVAVFTGYPRAPFASPDGQWIGFQDNTTVLMKVAVTGGPAVPLATFDVPVLLHGATWGPDDTIILATSGTSTGLQSIAAAGGPLTVLTKPDPALGEADHVWPELLPGGRAVLFTITALTGGLDAARIAVFDMRTRTSRVLVAGGTHARLARSGARDGDFLVYSFGGHADGGRI